MSFDTALVNLVGAGLVAAGSRYSAESARLARWPQAGMPDTAALMAFLSRDGFGRQIAALAQAMARSLVGPYRDNPDHVVRHLHGVAGILPEHGLSDDPEVEAAWARLRLAPASNFVRTGSAESTGETEAEFACERLAGAILALPAKAGLLSRAGLDQSFSQYILGTLLTALFTDRAGVTALHTALARFAQQQTRSPQASLGQSGMGQSGLAQSGMAASPSALVLGLRSRRSTPSPADRVDSAIQVRLDALRGRVEEAARRAGVPGAMLAAVTASLIAGGATGGRSAAHAPNPVSDDDVVRGLGTKIGEYRDLEHRLLRSSGVDTAVAMLRAQAASATGSGRLDLADRLLAQAEDVDQAAARENIENEVLHLRQASQSRALRGALDELRGAYRSASAHSAAAAAYLPPDDTRGRWRAMIRQARLLARQAEEHDEIEALEEAVTLHGACLRLRPRQTASKDWATAQHLFGTLLYRLSEIQGDGEHLQKAAQACRAAADELTGQREPMLWAQALTDYAVAVHRIGERTGDTAALTDALAAQRESLAVFTRSTSPQDWAQAQIGIAGTVLLMATGDGSRHRLTEAIASYRTALEVLDADAAPEVAVKARIRLAEALCLVARRDQQPLYLVEAGDTLAGIEQPPSKDRAPFEWARLQAVHGTVEMELGRRSRAGDRLLRAAELLESALEFYTPHAMPLQSAATQRDIGAAFEALSQLERSAEPRLIQAVAAYRAAVSVLDRDGTPRQWALTQLDLARALHRLGLETGFETDAEPLLVEALAGDQAALAALEKIGDGPLAAFVRDGIAERTAQLEQLRHATRMRR